MNTNKLFTELSMKKIWDKLTRHDEAFKTKLLILPSGNWVAQDDGTFTNTVSYAGFKETDNVCVDLHDDGTLTDTQITEYEQYIDRFKVIDSGIIAYANTQPTTTLMIVVRGEYEYLVDETDRVKAMITDAYSDEKEYATGDLCIKDNTLIKFTAAKGTGAWDDTVVETTTINKEFSLLNSKSNIVLLGSGNITASGQTIQLSDSIQNYKAIVISSNETTPSMMPASAISIGTTVFYLHGSSGTNMKVNTVKFQSDDVLISIAVGIAFPVYICGIR